MKPRHRLRDRIRVPIPQIDRGPQYLTVDRDDLVQIGEIISDKPASRDHPRIKIGMVLWFCGLFPWILRCC